MKRSQEEANQIVSRSLCGRCVHAFWGKDKEKLGILPDGSIRVLCKRLNWIIDDSDPRNKDIHLISCFADFADQVMQNAKLAGCWQCPCGLNGNENFTIGDLEYKDSLRNHIDHQGDSVAFIDCIALNAKKELYRGNYLDCPGYACRGLERE